MDLLSSRCFRWRSFQAGRKPFRHASRRNSLQLEGLEDRMVPATVTFAQFIHLGESPQVFAYTNNGGTSADFNTLPGGDAILLSFDPRFAPSLTGPLKAHLFLTSHTSAPNIAPLTGDDREFHRRRDGAAPAGETPALLPYAGSSSGSAASAVRSAFRARDRSWMSSKSE